MRSGGRRCSGRDGRRGDSIRAGHVMLLNDSGNSVCRSLPLAGVARPGWSRPRHGLGRAGGDPDAARGRVHRCRDLYGRVRCVQQLLRCAQHGSRLTNQTFSPTVTSPPGAAALGCWAVKTPFLFHRFLFPPTRMDSGGGGGEVGEVPHVLADDRLDAVETPMFMPKYSTRYSSLPGFGYDRVQPAYVSGPTGWPMTSTRLQRNGGRLDVLRQRASTAPTTSHSPRRSRRQRLSRLSTCRIVPRRSRTIRLTPRFCLLGALIGRSAGRQSIETRRTLPLIGQVVAARPAVVAEVIVAFVGPVLLAEAEAEPGEASP
jgi:hypothetical protein